MKKIIMPGFEVRPYRVIITGAKRAVMVMATSPAAAVSSVAAAENAPVSALRLDKRFGARTKTQNN